MALTKKAVRYVLGSLTPHALITDQAPNKKVNTLNSTTLTSSFTQPPPYRIAINGYGRIGRCVLRAIYEAGLEDRLQVVAINELADLKTIDHLTRFDSTHGPFPGQVSIQGEQLSINGRHIHILNQPDIDGLPWADLNIDLVMECTGTFRDRATAQRHINQGAKKLLFSQPAKRDVDNIVVYGINHQQLSGEEEIVSAASCTSNCVVPVIDSLHNAFGVDSGVVTTIHSAMNDQPVIDAYHHTDLRKTRSALTSMIPVDTDLARGIDRLLPALEGRFEARAMRVPLVNVSAIDLTVQLSRDVALEQVNQSLKHAAANDYCGVLGYTEEMLASIDFTHDPRSGIIDASQTRLAGSRLLKLLIWFDNEWGFANRMLDVSKTLLKIT